MAIIPITVGSADSEIIAQLTEAQRSGTGRFLNASNENISLHQGAAAGVSPVPATGSTVTLLITGAPGTVIPAGARVRAESGPPYWALDSETTIEGGGTVEAAATCLTLGEVEADAETLTYIVDDVVDVEATKSTVDLTFGGTDGTIVSIGRQVKKAADPQTWSVTEAGVVSGEIAATYGTATVTLTGAQGTVYPAGTHVKKAAVDTLWATNEEKTVTNGVEATYSTATVTLGIDTTAGEVTVPAGSHVKVAAVAGNWSTDDDVVCPAATAGTCLQVDLLGTPATVIAAGKRICKAADAATGPYWALDAEATIGGGGYVKANFTCTTKDHIEAAAYSLDTIKDAVAGWTGVENDNAATPGVEATYAEDVGVTCDTIGAVAAIAHAIDTVVTVIAGWSTVDNALAADTGLDAADGTVDVGVTCEANGPTEALAHSLDTLPTPPAGHTSCDNALDATLGTTAADGTVDADVTCETAGAIAALAHTLDTLPTPPVGHTSSDNALAATHGIDHVDGSVTVAAECDLAGKISAAAHELDTFVGAHVGLTTVDNASEATDGVDQEGWDSVINEAEATPGDDYLPGTDADVVLVPIGTAGLNWVDLSLEQESIHCICSSGDKLLQIYTGPNKQFGGFGA